MALDCGVYVYEQSSRINFCVAKCFLANLRWCLIEQVYQGGNVWSALAFQRTVYCAMIYNNLRRSPIGLGGVNMFRGGVYSFSLV